MQSIHVKLIDNSFISLVLSHISAFREYSYPANVTSDQKGYFVMCGGVWFQLMHSKDYILLQLHVGGLK